MKKKIKLALDDLSFLQHQSYKVWKNFLLPLPLLIFECLFLKKSLTGVALRKYLQDSGPLFIKFGQILALREDLFDPKTCHELSKLFNQQKAMTNSELKSELKKNNNSKKLQAKLKRLDKKAMAVGSIGQVHSATLKTEEKVIIKVLRKNIMSEFERDKKNLNSLIRFIKAILTKKNPEHPSLSTLATLEKIIDELIINIEKELDFTNEANNLIRFKKSISNKDKVVIPKVYREFSSQNVLVLEKLDGVDLNKFKSDPNISAKQKEEIANLAFNEILSEIFFYGNFHADPHAGNFIVTPEGKLGLIDFGLVGEFNSADKKKIIRALKAFLSKDQDLTIKALLEFGELPDNFDHDSFKAEVYSIYKEYKTNPVKIDQLVSQLFACAYKFDIFVPQNTSLFIKTLVTTQGLVKSLHPEFKTTKEASKIILKSSLFPWLKYFKTS